MGTCGFVRLVVLIGLMAVEIEGEQEEQGRDRGEMAIRGLECDFLYIIIVI